MRQKDNNTFNRSTNEAFFLSLIASSENELCELATQCLSNIKASDMVFPEYTFNNKPFLNTMDIEHRLIVKAISHFDLLKKLNHIIERNSSSGIFKGSVSKNRKLKIAFVYSGMGAQWFGMGQQLYNQFPVFKTTFEECRKVLRNINNKICLTERLMNSGTNCLPVDIDIAQPLNFALQISLTQLLKHFGIQPDALVGHSTGELSAFYESGIYSLEQAMKIAFIRGKLQKKLSGQGGLMAVNDSVDEIIDIISSLNSAIEIAAINSHNSLTVVGTKNDLLRLQNSLEDRVKSVFLDVDIPYHGKENEMIKEEFLNAVKCIYPSSSRTPCYSTVTSTMINGYEITPKYWWKNIRKPVYFTETIEQMLQDGFNTFIEIGPHPVLVQSIRQIADRKKISSEIFYTLKRNTNDIDILSKNICELFCAGIDFDISTILKNIKK